MLAAAMLLASLPSVSAAQFVPAADRQVNIICGFEDGDWLPMMPDTITDKDQFNEANISVGLTGDQKYTGAKAYHVSATSEDGGYCSFEWYQVQDGKHIYERNGHTELSALYTSGTGYRFENAEYLQLYVKNEANGPISLKWAALYGEDCWEIKPFAQYVTILKDGEWQKLTINNTFITIPRKYEGFIRIQLIPDNFRSGSWDGKTLKLDLVTAIRFYIDITGSVSGKLYIDDLAVVGKNVNVKNGTKIVSEQEYFKAFLGDSAQTPVTSQTPDSSSRPGPASSTPVASNTDASSQTSAVTSSASSAASSEDSGEPLVSSAGPGESSDTVSGIVSDTSDMPAGTSSEEEPAGLDGPDEEGGSIWPVIVLIVVIVAAGGGAVFFFLWKKKKAVK